MRFSAAPGANGSKTRLEELWQNCPVAAEPRDNAWAMHLLFKYGWTGLGFYSYVIQGLPRVLLTWYRNWKVNPDAVTADSRWKQSVVKRGTQQAADYVLPSSSPTCSRQLTAYINFVCSILFLSLAAFTAGFKGGFVAPIYCIYTVYIYQKMLLIRQRISIEMRRAWMYMSLCEPSGCIMDINIMA